MDKDFSIVVPVYFNETTLRYTESRIRELVFNKVPWKGEIIFVDDGSEDGSFKVLEELQKEHPEDIRVFKLSRNFGQCNAERCGIVNAPGAIIDISADGQDPIDLIPDMLDRYFNKGKEVVIAYRASRDETVWRRFTSWVVYSAIRFLGHPDMPTGGFDFMLLGKHAKEEYVRTYQPYTFDQVRVLKLGFERDWIPYHREDRKGGVSKWTFGKKLTYMIDGILGHSYLPIRAMSIAGFIFSGFSFLLGLYFLLSYIFVGHELPGWTPIVLMILFVGGVQMTMVGVLGEYLWRVLSQVRNDVPYIVEKRLEG